MHSAQTTVSARGAFLGRLIDDAGLFPPAALGLDRALEVDDAARAGGDAWLIGRFVVPAGRLSELLSLRAHAPHRLELSVIVDGEHVERDLELLAREAERIALSAVLGSIELRVPARPDGDVRDVLTEIVADIDASGLPASVAAYLEVGFGDDWRSHLTTLFDALADARARSSHAIYAKIRCGGDALPTTEQLAFAVGTMRALDMPFKATAGLHHPVRHRAGHGMAHGFLNVIGVAVLDHALDLDERTRQHVLAETDPASFRLDDEAFAWRDFAADGGAVSGARTVFVHSYGSCSLSEPADDLRALGVLT